MDAPVPLIIVALLAAGAVLAPEARARAWSMLGALALTPVLLLAHVWDNSAIAPLRDHPAVGIAAAVGALGLVAAFAVVIDRKPLVLPIAAVAALPFRVPISSGGSTSNLLVPLYLVVGAGVLAYAIPRLRGRDTPEEHPVGWLERVLAAAIVLYAIQATYSSDFSHALENAVFFYVPFSLLFVLLQRVPWTARLAGICLAVLAGLALVFVGIGFGEYATRHLLLNPKVITSNQFESYFRVNSLFFDPNIYGRFLAIVMIGLAGVLLWTRRTRDVVVTAALLAVLWAGLVLTFSQSSFVALIVGLAMLGGMRWSPSRAAALAAAGIAVAVAFVAIAPHAIRLNIGDSRSADSATSGRYDLVKGGVNLFADAPLVGQGAGSFALEYRRRERSSNQRAASASHTIPITVAAEQGVIGLALYLALLALAFVRLLRGASRWLPRAVVGAAFAALVVHTLMYAAFLEDPLTWTLLGVGVALARLAGGRTTDEPAPATAEPTRPEPTPA